MTNALKTEKKDARFFDGERGFSLIEMAVAMTIFLIVLGSVYGMLSLGRLDRGRASSRSDVMKNARAAMHLIGRDALNAGFQFHRRGAVVPDNFVGNVLGIPVDMDTDNDVLPAIVAGDNINPSNLQTDNNTDIISICYRDLNFNVTPPAAAFGGDSPASPPASSGESIPIGITDAFHDNGTPEDVTTLKTGNGEANKVNPYDLLLLESGNSQILFMPTATAGGNKLRIAPSDPLGLNKPYNGDEAESSVLNLCTDIRMGNCVSSYAGASAKKIRWISYKLSPEGTLFRVIYGNNADRPSDEQIQQQPIAYNIADMQFKYVLKNGKVTDNPAAGPDNIAGTEDDTPDDLILIRQVTVTIKVQSTERDEQTKQYEVITMSSTFSTRNLQYDAG